jgi:hypothetical protein
MAKSELPAPQCRGGYPAYQVEEILGDRAEEFWAWMRGQTMMLCNGERYNHDTQMYEASCGGVAHGTVVYPWDLLRFLEGRAVID